MTTVRARLWVDGHEVNLSPAVANLIHIISMHADQKRRLKRRRRAMKKTLETKP